jgi:hypothetical protein
VIPRARRGQAFQFLGELGRAFGIRDAVAHLLGRGLARVERVPVVETSLQAEPVACGGIEDRDVILPGAGDYEALALKELHHAVAIGDAAGIDLAAEKSGDGFSNIVLERLPLTGGTRTQLGEVVGKADVLGAGRVVRIGQAVLGVDP